MTSQNILNLRKPQPKKQSFLKHALIIAGESLVAFSVLVLIFAYIVAFN